MSSNRRDLHRARLRRERIRRQKHAERGGPGREIPDTPRGLADHPFASERALLEIHSLMEGGRF